MLIFFTRKSRIICRNLHVIESLENHTFSAISGVF
jgi:hypothetical protein